MTDLTGPEDPRRLISTVIRTGNEHNHVQGLEMKGYQKQVATIVESLDTTTIDNPDSFAFPLYDTIHIRMTAGSVVEQVGCYKDRSGKVSSLLVIYKEPQTNKTEDLGMDTSFVYCINLIDLNSGGIRILKLKVDQSGENSKPDKQEIAKKIQDLINSKESKQLNTFDPDDLEGSDVYVQLEKAIDILQKKILSDEDLNLVTDNYIPPDAIEEIFSKLKAIYLKHSKALKGLHLRFTVSDGTDVRRKLNQVAFKEAFDFTHLLGPKLKINPKSSAIGVTEFELVFD